MGSILRANGTGDAKIWDWLQRTRRDRLSWLWQVHSNEFVTGGENQNKTKPQNPPAPAGDLKTVGEPGLT